MTAAWRDLVRLRVVIGPWPGVFCESFSHLLSHGDIRAAQAWSHPTMWSKTTCGGARTGLVKNSKIASTGPEMSMRWHSP